MSVSKTLRRRKGWIALGVLAVIGAAAYLVLSGGGEEAATTVYTTEPAETGTISVTVSGTGNLVVDGTSEVWPSTAGTVDSVAVEEGDAVATGTVLFTLDAEEAEANTAKALAGYRQSQQSVANSEASLLRAENNLVELQERYDEQVSTTSSLGSVTAQVTTEPAAPADESVDTDTPDADGGGTETAQTVEVTQADLDEAQMDVDSAEAGLSSANASLASASLSLAAAQETEADLTVCSPCSGTVWSLDVADGDSVSPEGSSASGASQTTGASDSGAPVVIAQSQPLALLLTVNEVDMPTLEVGQRAEIEFDALPDLTATGKVTEIAEAGTVEQGVVTFDVTLSIDVVDDSLRSGMSGAAAIVTDIERDALLVPNAAVRSDGDGGYYVLVLRPEAAPSETPVTIGLANATHSQILSGIEAGDEVVTQTTESTDEEEASGTGFMLPGMGGGRPRE